MADPQHLRGGGVSRRKALLTGAGIVAAGAVGAAGGVVVTKAAEGTLSAAKGNPQKPVMVHLRDAPTGKFDIFVGDEKFEVTDTNFAAKLVQTAAKAA